MNRFIEHPAAGAVVAEVEKLAPVKKIAAGNGVFPQLQVASQNGVEGVRRGWHQARDSTKLDTRTTCAYVDVCEKPSDAVRKRSGVPRGNGVRAKFIQKGQRVCIQRAAAAWRRQLRQAGRGWRERKCPVERIRIDDLIVKAAKDCGARARQAKSGSGAR